MPFCGGGQLQQRFVRWVYVANYIARFASKGRVQKAIVHHIFFLEEKQVSISVPLLTFEMKRAVYRHGHLYLDNPEPEATYALTSPVSQEKRTLNAPTEKLPRN